MPTLCHVGDACWETCVAQDEYSLKRGAITDTNELHTLNKCSDMHGTGEFYTSFTNKITIEIITEIPKFYDTPENQVAGTVKRNSTQGHFTISATIFIHYSSMCTLRKIHHILNQEIELYRAWSKPSPCPKFPLLTCATEKYFLWKCVQWKDLAFARKGALPSVKNWTV